MRIRPARYAEILGALNADALMREYSAECSLAELGPIDPQPELYAAMEKSGAMQAFGVYEGDELAGFTNLIVYTPPHYGKKIVATESIFLAQAHRRGAMGMEMLDFVENFGRDHRCAGAQYSAPVGSRFSQLLFLNGDLYRHSNNVFVRAL